MFAWGTPSRPRASTSSAPGSTTPDGAQPAKAFLLGLVLATYLTGANGRPNSDIARHLRIGPIGERTPSLANFRCKIVWARFYGGRRVLEARLRWGRSAVIRTQRLLLTTPQPTQRCIPAGPR